MTDPLLNEMISYYNEDVISRFTGLFAIEESEAEDIFHETKKFLAICREPGMFIPDELLIVDEMWHNFILFTKEYQHFCTQYFGSYVHHLPASKKEKLLQQQKNAADPEAASREFNERLAVVLSTVYDRFGEETVVKWFSYYPQRYSREAIKTIRRN